MSLAVVLSRGLAGLDAPLVTVEVHLAGGLPAFNLVGLPDTEVKEARDRVRAAMQNAQFAFPARRITVQWLYNLLDVSVGAGAYVLLSLGNQNYRPTAVIANRRRQLTSDVPTSVVVALPMATTSTDIGLPEPQARHIAIPPPVIRARKDPCFGRCSPRRTVLFCATFAIRLMPINTVR